MKFTINKESLYLGFLFFSTVFFIKYILIKPVYILLIAVIFFGYYSGRYLLNSSYIVVGYLFLMFLFFHLLVLESDVGMVLNAVLSILVYPVFYYYSKSVKLKQVKFFLNLCIFYLFVEMLWRLLNPVYEIENVNLVSETGSGWFYPYKINSFMFTDSNFVALHIYCLLAICLFLKLRVHYFFLILLMLLTFSRSGILGAVLLTLYVYFDSNNILRYFKKIFIFIFLFVSIYVVMNIDFMQDGSFLSKFHIYDMALNYVESSFSYYDYLFGVGLSHSYDLIGIGAHSIGVILLFETGVIGTLIYISYFIVFLSKRYSNSFYSKRNLLAFLGVFFFMGFSLGLYLFPIMVLSVALIQNSKEVLGGK